MAQPTIVHYTVRGHGQFPIDMLRYDSAWPYSGEDADKIGTVDGALERREVRLSTYKRPKGQNNFTSKRWDSFNWQVIKEF